MNELLDHLPSYYHKVREFQHLTEAQSTELDAIDDALLSVENDQFILTSSERAIARREKEFRIVPDLAKESLEMRKKRLLLRMKSNPPYVLEYLKNMFEGLLGPNQYHVNLDVVRFEMEVLISVDSGAFHDEVRQLVERIVPLNIAISMALLVAKDILKLRGKARSFGVPYPITNMFLTAEMPGGIAHGSMRLLPKSRDFGVIYPITNVLYPTGNVLLEKTNLLVSAKTFVWHSEFQRLNDNMRAGEVTL